MTQQTPYRRLRALRDRFAPPPGLTWPEISDGKLVMMLRPGPRHQLTAMTDMDDEALGVLHVPDLHVCRDAAMETDDPLDPRDGTWTYQWGIVRRPAYDNRLRLPYGEPVTVTTDLGTWTIETGDLPRYSAKDMGP
ncbi:hypothetical protein [Streptomyces acidiscabies]|uniref:Uncharacterized protein n=1 Tax=Streptomyces acidiscabies TaxID=42234 RepID=A0AAP6BI38_9ACTN|nr:hypothetical protein [Streptomyces acidiscabies]MDX2965131.1 hypothetical protein [Streptomyces acidiscabies]MDX3023639.1 hypothetical protein [Streptomyces acidiscabies]MDX3789717.1 hypothetical protein [Streptomyces acidiscabies]GAQ57670.1 hypothetical protein a10_07542 [Streptomyces acidiscabies]GAV45051.1 hypothetical protein Saa2_08034 [Streptomyces acidiscabies]